MKNPNRRLRCMRIEAQLRISAATTVGLWQAHDCAYVLRTCKLQYSPFRVVKQFQFAKWRFLFRELRYWSSSSSANLSGTGSFVTPVKKKKKLANDVVEIPTAPGVREASGLAPFSTTTGRSRAVMFQTFLASKTKLFVVTKIFLT